MFYVSKCDSESNSSPEKEAIEEEARKAIVENMQKAVKEFEIMEREEVEKESEDVEKKMEVLWKFVPILQRVIARDEETKKSETKRDKLM